MMTIDLRSDTVTRPTEAMREAMASAEVGDDVFGEDPTINRLEAKIASMFGKESAIFCPSGTMTNQIAIKIHTSPGDEVICDRKSHIYNYEGGGIAFNSGCSVKLLHGDRGRFSAVDVQEAINPDDAHYAHTALVSLENTVNKGGGSIYPLETIREIRTICENSDLPMHLDGARLFNALVETKQRPEEIGALFETISICLSKGLGAPVGSLLIGSHEHIAKARRVRKVLGGGMRQAGYLAAAGIYALDNHVERLTEDNDRARSIGEILEPLDFVDSVQPIETNIVLFSLREDVDPSRFIATLAEHEVRVVPFGGQWIRMVTHLQFDDTMLERLSGVLRELHF